MKLKGRKPSINVEYHDKFKNSSGANDRQAKINQVGTALNRMAKQKTTPLPSPRGEAPKKRPKADPKQLGALNTFVSHPEFEKFKKGMDKPQNINSPYETYVTPRKKKPKGAFEEAVAKKEAEDAKKRGKQKPRPKYDKKTGKKL